MNSITANYLTRAEVWLFVTTLAYFLMNGAQIFETAVVVPKWTAAPPESLRLFQGKYGLDFKMFWIIMHSIHEITFILAIIFCWKIAPVRNGLLLLFVIHVAVRVWTLTYFAPNIIAFQKAADTTGVDTDLLSRAGLWRTMNYIRVGLFIALSLGLLPLCAKVLSMKVR